jgi:hypothetical protein
VAKSIPAESIQEIVLLPSAKIGFLHLKDESIKDKVLNLRSLVIEDVSDAKENIPNDFVPKKQPLWIAVKNIPTNVTASSVAYSLNLKVFISLFKGDAIVLMKNEAEQKRYLAMGKITLNNQEVLHTAFFFLFFF